MCPFQHVPLCALFRGTGEATGAESGAASHSLGSGQAHRIGEGLLAPGPLSEDIPTGLLALGTSQLGFICRFAGASWNWEPARCAPPAQPSVFGLRRQ